MAQVLDWTLVSLVGSGLGQVIKIPVPHGVRLAIYLDEFKDLLLRASFSSQYWATLGVIYYLPLIINLPITTICSVRLLMQSAYRIVARNNCSENTSCY